LHEKLLLKIAQTEKIDDNSLIIEVNLEGGRFIFSRFTVL
jgi:hypothetical protein